MVTETLIFFHASTLEKRNRLRISRIKHPDGTWLDQEEDIKTHAADFFQQLLSQESEDPDSTTRNLFLRSVPSLVSSADNQDLLRPVTLDEVRGAVFLYGS